MGGVSEDQANASVILTYRNYFATVVLCRGIFGSCRLPAPAQHSTIEVTPTRRIPRQQRDHVSGNLIHATHILTGLKWVKVG